ncbi:DUF262 domain-containing protein [Streptomyces sp. NPDC102256]|uniref:DUF262 domain-containing protein n=1 Tax=Streptomyces sp. NPDC102256 TaxID=3366147 RepID=UPI003800A9FB
MTEQFYRPKPTSYDIPYLVDKALDGTLRVPKFQRNFVWDTSDVRKLFDSIWRGFPIGTLLLWKSPAESEEVKLGPIRLQVEQRTDALWVVDGQQRLISLVGTLNRRFRAVDDRFEVYFDLRRGRFVTSSKSSVPPTWLPLREALETRSLLSWLREHDADLEPRDFDVADALGGALRDYQVPAYIVENNDDAVLREVFDRVNSAGKPIRRAAIFHALFASDTDPGSPATVTESLKRLGFGSVEQLRVVQSLLALRGGDVQRDLHDEFSNVEDVPDWYDKTEQALELAIKFLRSQGVAHISLMPATFPLPVLAAFFHLHPDPEPWTLNLLGKWLWRGWTHGFGKHGQTPALRQDVRMVNPKKGMPGEAPSESDAVRALLRTVADEEPGDLRLTPFRAAKASGRLAQLALAAQEPRGLDGTKIDLAAEFEARGGQAVTDLVKNKRTDLGARGFWPYGSPAPTGHESAEVLASHVISSDSAMLLRESKIDEFVETRRRDIEELTHRFLSARIDAGSLIRPPLSLLVVEEEDD